MAERPLARLFVEGDDSSKVLLAWWADLQERPGDRAALRRSSNPVEVVFCPAFHSLLGDLRSAGYPLGSDGAAGLAVVSGLAAHVREVSAEGSLARQMAAPRAAGTGARLSGLRFRRLLAIPSREELFPALVRVIRLLDGRIDLPDLARSSFWWGDHTRKRWAYEYYDAAPSEK